MLVHFSFSQLFTSLQVHASYSSGTFRFGPLDQISLVGVKREEIGDYYVDLISHLQRCPFLEQVMPWGPMSTLKSIQPQQSNDGPILWIRPGEQTIPTGPNSTSQIVTPTAGKRISQNELRLLMRRSNEPREQMFEDR